ncbi:MAG: adenylate/guanylate cyclase domain-containing protein [Rhodospirillales bacterium]
MTGMASPRTLARLRLWLTVTVSASIIGAVYWSILGAVYGAESGLAMPLHGAQYGAVIGATLGLFQVMFAASAASASFRRAPFALALLARTAAAAAIILAALIFCRMTLGPGPFHSSALALELIRDAGVAAAIFAAISFVVMMQRFIGGRVLLNFVIGRYHRPVREDRVFLFLDLADSTALSQHLGDIGVHALISEVFFDIDAVILEHGGEVYRYIGDEIVVTWFLADCRDDGRCLNCYQSIQALIARRADIYRSRFGVVPVFRAGMHGGPVVVGECGDSKREIAYFGDTINTAARLCGACKTFGASLLVSGDLLSRIAAPANLSLQRLGEIVLTGRDEATTVYGIGNRWEPRAQPQENSAVDTAVRIRGAAGPPARSP